MVLKLLAAFWMLAKLLIVLIMLFFLINYSNGICLLSSPELFLNGTRIRGLMFPGITATLTNSQFLMVYVKVGCHPLFCLLCSLIFNANKTQLAHFSHSIFSSIDSINATTFCFGGQKLQLSQSAKHLGHILCCNLSDNEDISSIKKDLTRKANCMLHTFSCCDPLTKTMLFRSFCLSLYSSALWMSSSSELRSLEVTFNNILRKIWSLPRAYYHTGILHQVAGLHSIFNVVVS